MNHRSGDLHLIETTLCGCTDEQGHRAIRVSDRWIPLRGRSARAVKPGERVRVLYRNSVDGAWDLLALRSASQDGIVPLGPQVRGTFLALFVGVFLASLMWNTYVSLVLFAPLLVVCLTLTARRWRVQRWFRRLEVRAAAATSPITRDRAMRVIEADCPCGASERAQLRALRAANDSVDLESNIIPFPVGRRGLRG
jgi:hypothetical protein